jgi:hypothetical protein
MSAKPIGKKTRQQYMKDAEVVVHETHALPPNDRSSATATTRRADCSRDDPAAVRCSAWLGDVI